MALNIKDPATDRPAHQLAEATGGSITVSARVRARANRADQAAELDAIITRGRERAKLDDRTADDIVGYDEHGLPS